MYRVVELSGKRFACLCDLEDAAERENIRELVNNGCIVELIEDKEEIEEMFGDDITFV